MSIKSNFVFVVFNDPIVVGTINFLASVMSGRYANLSPHLTIQGPFLEKVSGESIRGIKKRLEGDTFFIGNPGIFETRQGAVLFLKATSEHLPSVWNKPDYPVRSFGFNPHITIYEGLDISRARRARDFLGKNRIELLCRDFDVVQYVPKQQDMFPVEGVAGDENAISALIGAGKLSSGFRASFMAAVNGSFG